MHVFQHFDYLRHHDHLLNNFLQNMGHLNDAILGDNDGITLPLHDLSDSPQCLFDEIDPSLYHFFLLSYQLLLHL